MARGQASELVFKTFFAGYFIQTDFEVVNKPMGLAKLYADDHGIRPDFFIYNQSTEKGCFVEIKRQHEGRGNAHERACRYFTPGLIEAMQQYCKVYDSIPVWLVFSNGITRDKRRVREVRFWFNGHEANYLFWPDLNKTAYIKEHFEKYIRPMLNS